MTLVPVHSTETGSAAADGTAALMNTSANAAMVKKSLRMVIPPEMKALRGAALQSRSGSSRIACEFVGKCCARFYAGASADVLPDLAHAQSFDHPGGGQPTADAEKHPLFRARTFPRGRFARLEVLTDAAPNGGEPAQRAELDGGGRGRSANVGTASCDEGAGRHESWRPAPS
ncbi:hypothetical protein GCM10023169_10440 [Georgenia halophila]|uniref:Uncharacterized protein n=1 Tax=Georgenia halophila TaxID=620889 RepID=A0ABP8KZW6_9MICO